MEEESLPSPADRLDAPGISRRVSVSEFSCHCCYDILINPTTLNCGHSFCRHCLALWWTSSKKNECPECREKWEGFPKVNILLRNAVEKLFPVAIEQRKDDILQNHEATQSLAAFQKYGSDQPTAVPSAGRVNPPGGGFFSGVLTALTCVAVQLPEDIFHKHCHDGRGGGLAGHRLSSGAEQALQGRLSFRCGSLTACMETREGAWLPAQFLSLVHGCHFLFGAQEARLKGSGCGWLASCAA